MSTQDPLNPELHRALLDWVQIRCRDFSGKAPLRLYSSLRNPAVFWNEIASGFHSTLIAHLAAASRLGEATDEAHARPALRDDSSNSWWHDAGQIRESWLGSQPPDWQELLVALVENGNELVSGCVTSSLQESLGCCPVPESVQNSVEAFVRQDGEAVERLLREMRRSEPAGDQGGSEKQAREGAAGEPPLSPLAGLLGPLAEKLAGSSDLEAQQLANRLRELIPEAARLGHDRDTWKRRVLQQLIRVDDIAAAPGQPPSWAPEVRQVLRDLLLDDGDYVLLDQQLLRRSLRSSHDLAEAVGYTASPGHSAHQIVRVLKPGYALRSRDGSLEVLKRAKVLLGQ